MTSICQAWHLFQETCSKLSPGIQRLKESSLIYPLPELPRLLQPRQSSGISCVRCRTLVGVLFVHFRL